MAELKTFDTNGNYMKNLLHGYVDISSGAGDEVHSIVAVPGTVNFFVFYEVGGSVKSPLVGYYIVNAYIEGGFLKVETSGTFTGAITARIHYGIYIDD